MTVPLQVKATKNDPKRSNHYEGELENCLYSSVWILQFNLFIVREVCFENKCLISQTRAE